ncbi:hypothetical protein HMPREF2992_03685 [Prevotella sp. HMSC069G02]|nr:hypothetical protein HMPREF2992_03685 [Prevotella sp. HMSC069G02]
MLSDFLREVYDGFDTSTEIEPGMWRELLRLMHEAAVQGLARGDYQPQHNDDFLNAMRHGNEVFAAFKVHAMGEAMAAKLLDSNGHLKPFEQWLNDVQSISSHHVGAWLRTEYNTAVLRAHAAADWQEFVRNKDVMPNLRWMPTTSPDAEASHQSYWEKKLTLPVDHPFWAKHHPQDRWNCKCSLEATDEPASPADLVEDMPAPSPQQGLDNNPGKDGHIISDTHPYFPENCAHCPFYKPQGVKNKLKAVFLNRKKDCFHCSYIDAKLPDNKGFILKNKYKNGGTLSIHELVDRKKSDYHDIVAVAQSFAKAGHKAEITPSVHFKSEEYKQIYGSLIGTKYERKCPDFRVDGIFYEYESFVRPWNKKKVGRMLSHGMEQSPYIVINNTKGCSDRFIRKNIIARTNINADIQEVWVYEKGKIRPFFKAGEFIK